jgi:hypothetical protein
MQRLSNQMETVLSDEEDKTRYGASFKTFV